MEKRTCPVFFGHDAGHIDLALQNPNGSYTMGGYYGERPGLNVPGFVNLTHDDWFNGPAKRRDYASGNYNSLICRKKVCPSQIDQMDQALKDLKANPGTFNLLTNNCSYNSCNILSAGGAFPANSNISFPRALSAWAANNGWDCNVGTTSMNGDNARLTLGHKWNGVYP